MIKKHVNPGWLLAVLAALLMVGAAVSPVSAAPVLSEGENMEAFYQRELEMLDSQAARLLKADDVIAQVEAYIAEQQAEGSDTSGAEEALSAFKQALVGIKADHAEAQSILNTHSGIDSAGQVIDQAAALQTVRTAGEALRQAHLNLVQGLKDLRTSLRENHSYTGIEQACQKLLDTQQAQADQLLKGQNVIDRMNTFITEQQDLGNNTGSLESALATFESAYASAEVDHNLAADILDEHSGFDSSGTLTDPELARITLTSAGEAQRQFHLTASQARIDIREAVEEYRDSLEGSGS